MYKRQVFGLGRGTALEGMLLMAQTDRTEAETMTEWDRLLAQEDLEGLLRLVRRGRGSGTTTDPTEETAPPTHRLPLPHPQPPTTLPTP